MKGVPPDLEELLRDLEDNRPAHKRLTGFIGGAIGAVVGAVVGVLVLLPIFGLFGDGQNGLAAVLLGVPFGAWAGAEMGARWAGR